MAVTARIEEVRNEVTEMAKAAPMAQGLMRSMVKLLHDRMLKYNWVGFYMLEPGTQPAVLVLGAFEGAMTPHTRIPLNQGICGAAASSGQTVVVDDVSRDPRNQIGDCGSGLRPRQDYGRTRHRQPLPCRVHGRTSDLCAALCDACRKETGSCREMKRVVAGLIVRDGKLLVCQRTRHQTMPLKWEFPGGKIEEGEQPRDALRRELDEELGIAATIGDEVARIQHEYPNGGMVELRFYLVREFKGELENRIFRDMQWIQPKNLPKFDFLEADLTLVKDLAAGKLL
jgi:8-oxo-dGTP diphosphatase